MKLRLPLTLGRSEVGERREPVGGRNSPANGAHSDIRQDAGL
jgi:hypothetical protein